MYRLALSEIPARRNQGRPKVRHAVAELIGKCPPKYKN